MDFCAKFSQKNSKVKKIIKPFFIKPFGFFLKRIRSRKGQVRKNQNIHKKCNFIEKVISELGINLKIICSRIEEIAHHDDHRENYDICLSRAVSNISTLNEFSLPLLKLYGKSICIKGNNISNEIINSEYSAEVLGGKMINYSTTSSKSTIVIYKKFKKTPDLYPRKTGIPKKNPLGIS